MKTKKFLSLVTLVALLVASLGTVSTAAAEAYDKVVYAYATFNNIPTDETLTTVEEAINAITRDKIGVEVELKPIMIWDYSSTVSLALQGGEQVDIYQTLGDLNTGISTGMCMDITDLAATLRPRNRWR